MWGPRVSGLALLPAPRSAASRGGAVVEEPGGAGGCGRGGKEERGGQGGERGAFLLSSFEVSLSAVRENYVVRVRRVALEHFSNNSRKINWQIN